MEWSRKIHPTDVTFQPLAILWLNSCEAPQIVLANTEVEEIGALYVPWCTTPEAVGGTSSATGGAHSLAIYALHLGETDEYPLHDYQQLREDLQKWPIGIMPH